MVNDDDHFRSASAAPVARIADDDHERIVIRQDPATGLRFIVAVHSTVLGPALGGLRLKRYPGGLREALADVMGLARTMTLKASAAGLDARRRQGRDDRRRPTTTRATPASSGAAGVIDELDGAYITAEDIGTTTADMDLMSRHTPYVVGRSSSAAAAATPPPSPPRRSSRRCAAGSARPPAPTSWTAGAWAWSGSARSATRWPRGWRDAGARRGGLRPRRGARGALRGRARDPRRAVGRGGARHATLDVLAPCAAGGMIDDALARALDCRVVAGAANNPLTEPRGGAHAGRRGILYVPDFLANCGGLIHVAGEWYGEDGPDEAELVERAMDCLERAIATAEAEGSTPVDVAERQALERVASARP